MCTTPVTSSIADEEMLLRTSYSPMHINTKTGKPRPSCLKPVIKEPDEEDPSKMNNRVSVTRLCYSGWQFCIDHARRHQTEKKTLHGFLRILASNVKALGLWLQPKPVPDNPYHANMIFTEINKPHGEELDELESGPLLEKLRLMVNSGEYFTEDEAVRMAETENH